MFDKIQESSDNPATIEKQKADLLKASIKNCTLCLGHVESIIADIGKLLPRAGQSLTA